MSKRTAVVGALILVACNNPNESRSESGPAPVVAQDAPVKYEVCNAQGADCRLVARFVKYEDCDEYKKTSGMLCNSMTPGVITCRENTNPVKASSSRCSRQ